MARGRKRAANASTDGAAVAQSMQSKRTTTNTKRTYQSKVNIMTAWLAEHYPDTIDDETKSMRIPLPTKAVLEFFGHLCSPANIFDQDNISASTAPTEPLSVSYVCGFRSALLDVYRAKLLDFDHPLEAKLQRLLDGYEKVINDLKKRGLMKINEGKRDLKASGFGMLALKLMTDAPTRKGQSWVTVTFGWSYFMARIGSSNSA